MRAQLYALTMVAVTLSGCAKSNAPAAADSATAAGAATAATADPQAARQAIDSVLRRFTDAMARGDAKTAGSMYTSDAIAAFPGAPLFTGADSITKAFEGDFAAITVQNPNLHTDGLVTAGNLAVENGTWSWVAQPKQAGSKGDPQSGHYLTVWQHQADGTWKIFRDYVVQDPTTPKAK